MIADSQGSKPEKRRAAVNWRLAEPQYWPRCENCHHLAKPERARDGLYCGQPGADFETQKAAVCDHYQS